MKKLLTFVAVMVMTQMAMAIPAKRIVQTVRQPNGTELQVILRGDETFHFYTTIDGTPVRCNAQGYWETDTRDINALWRERASLRAEQRRPAAERIRRQLRDEAQRRAAARKKVATRADGDGSNTETEVQKKKGLLVLVNFKDKTLSTPTARIKTVYDQILNSVNNPYGDNYGSVHEYFLAQSYGELDVEFDVAGPVTLKNNMSYYGKDDGGEGNDAHPEEMVVEALKGVNDDVNFADYDWDGDGEVENVYVIYAGYGQASGAPSNTIWPHQWELSATNNALTLDGVRLDTYACGSELYGTSGTELDGIGTMCHEYSHCLGLPDFYDINYNETNPIFGMSYWSIMDSGCYSGDGYCPAGYTAYERWYSGWLTPTVLDDGATIENMPAIEDEPVAYVVYNDGAPAGPSALTGAEHAEFYLLANHQQKGWDTEAMGHGMMIIHADEDLSVWQSNEVNTTASRQRMTIIPADGKAQAKSYSDFTGDLWPGTSSNHALTDTSDPAAKLYRNNTDGKKFMHKDITEITESSGQISFTFMGGKQTLVPTPEPDEDNVIINDKAFTAQWDAVTGAVSYNLQWREVTQTEDNSDAVIDAICMYELFDDFFADNDGNMDLGAELDDYTLYPGWTGYKVYQGVAGAKIGASKAAGWLQTPAVENSTGKVTVFLGLSHWYNSWGVADEAPVDVTIMGLDGAELMHETVEPDDDNYIALVFNGVPEAFMVKLSTPKAKQRFYIDTIILLDGEFTVEDVESVLEDSEGDDEEYYSRGRNKAPLRAPQRATKYGEWQTQQGITSTEYQVLGLHYAGAYQWRVQAVDSEGNLSRWSDIQDVQLSGTVGIDMVSQSAATTSPGIIYDLSGRRQDATSLQRGLYIRDGRKYVVR